MIGDREFEVRLNLTEVVEALGLTFQREAVKEDWGKGLETVYEQWVVRSPGTETQGASQPLEETIAMHVLHILRVSVMEVEDEADSAQA